MLTRQVPCLVTGEQPWSTLDPGGAAPSESLNLFQGDHARVPRRGGEQGTVGPAEPDGFLGCGSAQQSVDEARSEAVPAAHAIQDIQLARGRVYGPAIDPGHGAPRVALRRMDR